MVTYAECRDISAHKVTDRCRYFPIYRPNHDMGKYLYMSSQTGYAEISVYAHRVTDLRCRYFPISWFGLYMGKYLYMSSQTGYAEITVYGDIHCREISAHKVTNLRCRFFPVSWFGTIYGEISVHEFADISPYHWFGLYMGTSPQTRCQTFGADISP